MVGIKDFGMPSCCINCDCCLPCALDEGLCHITQKTLSDIYDKRDSDCPLVEIEECKVSKWIVKDGKKQGYDIAGIKTWYIQIVCNKCGFTETAIEGHTGQLKYCPCCGAEMRGVEDE